MARAVRIKKKQRPDMRKNDVLDHRIRTASREEQDMEKLAMITTKLMEKFQEIPNYEEHVQEEIRNLDTQIQ